MFDLDAVIHCALGSRVVSPKRIIKLARAKAIAAAFIAGLDVPAHVVGSVRREEPEVGDIDIVVVGTPTTLPVGASLIGGGVHLRHYRFRGQIIDVWQAAPGALGAMLLFATGPKNYGIGLRMRAKKRGLKLNRYGLWRGEECIARRTEAEIYAALDKPYRPPEMRGRRASRAAPRVAPRTALIDLDAIIARVQRLRR